MSSVIDLGESAQGGRMFSVCLDADETKALLRSVGEARTTWMAPELDRIISEGLEDLMLEDDA